MTQEEKTLKKEYKYKGRVVNVRSDEAQLPDGKLVQREVVEHPGGVVIALEDTDRTFFLLPNGAMHKLDHFLNFQQEN